MSFSQELERESILHHFSLFFLIHIKNQSSTMLPATFYYIAICMLFCGFNFIVSSCHQTDNLNILPNQVTSSSNFLFGTASSCYQYEGAILSDGEEVVQDPEVCRYLLQEASGQFCFHATHFYGLKEHVLATCLIDALSMSGDSDDAHHLLNWQKGGPKTASNSGNFSLVATEVVLGQESSMKCNPAEATNLRGRLDLPYKLPRPVAVIPFCVPRSLNAAITENFPSPFATQLSWSSVSLLIATL